MEELIGEAQVKKSISQIVGEFDSEGILNLQDYKCVGIFKSVRRAIRRGHVSVLGNVYPNRPFNNRKSPKGSYNYMRRRYYEQFKHRSNKVS